MLVRNIKLNDTCLHMERHGALDLCQISHMDSHALNTRISENCEQIGSCE
jgi:hypothetical protein